MELTVGGRHRTPRCQSLITLSSLSKLRINVERQRSFDYSSLSGVSHSGGYGRGGIDGMYSPGGGLCSLVGTPASSRLRQMVAVKGGERAGGGDMCCLLGCPSRRFLPRTYVTHGEDLKRSMAPWMIMTLL